MRDGAFIVLHGSKERDPDGQKVSAVLRAHYACERSREMRTLLVYVLAASSVLVWPLAVWPRFDGGRLRALALAFWAATFASVVAAWIQERLRQSARARLMADLNGERKCG